MNLQTQLKLIALRRQLSEASLKLLAAQRKQAHAEKKYGTASDLAAQAAQHCEDMSLRFSRLQAEYLSLRSSDNR